MRQWAADHDVRPDLVLCSTAVRARATLDLVAPALGAPGGRVRGRALPRVGRRICSSGCGASAPELDERAADRPQPGLPRSRRAARAARSRRRSRPVRSRSCGSLPTTGGIFGRAVPSSAGSSCRASWRASRSAARPRRARTAALSRTLAPLTQSSHAVSSAGSWLTPPMRRDEHHPARRDRGERLGVVAGARRQLHRRQAEIGGGAREGRADALGGRRGRDAPDGLDRHLEPVRLRRRVRQLRERAARATRAPARRATGTRGGASRVPARR